MSSPLDDPVHGGKDAVEVTNMILEHREKIINAVAKPLALFLTVAPSFAGVSIAMSKATPGICQASTVRSNLVFTLIPCAFITAMTLYGVIIYFVLSGIPLPSIEQGIAAVGLAAILGTGTFWGAVGLGDITKSAIVALAQQKKFLTSFFLLLVFTEFAGLFSFVVCLTGISSLSTK
jgi:F0F1-type ATP synthase membrane subunit c/vacuolar-type H+-ATPase subunit K